MNFFLKVILMCFLVPIIGMAQSTQATKGGFKRYKSIKKALRTSETVYFLDLSGQNLQNPPPEISRLTSLRILNLSRNGIKELPDFVFGLPHLETLILSHNMIACLPDKMAELKWLKKLDLQDNRFTMIPQVILQLTELRFIDFSYNSISDSEIMTISEAMPTCIIRGSPKL